MSMSSDRLMGLRFSHSGSSICREGGEPRFWAWTKMSRRATAWIFPSTTGRTNTEKLNLWECSQGKDLRERQSLGGWVSQSPPRLIQRGGHAEVIKHLLLGEGSKGKAAMTCSRWGRVRGPCSRSWWTGRVSNSCAFTLSPKGDLTHIPMGSRSKYQPCFLPKPNRM